MKNNKLGSGIGYGHRTLKVEQLEGRAMLAGNVAVSVSGGNLFVTGDNHDNAVLIQEVDDGDGNANTHAYEITGFDFADSGLPGFQAGATTISGGGVAVEADLGGTSARIVKGVTANIIVNLKKGNDALAVGNSIDDLLALADDCGFGLGLGSGSGSGSGSASVSISAAAVAQQPVLESRLTAPLNLIINMGDGNNAVAVIGDIGVNHNAGSLIVNGGKNTDNVAVGNAFMAESDSIVHGDVAITTGQGNDNVCVDNATIFGALAINAGDGTNTIGAENFGAAAAAIVSGKNNDNISVVSFDLDSALTINAGNGNNNVLVEDFDAGQGDGPNERGHGGGVVTVVTGSGHDNVGLFNFSADTVVVNTGSGNDGTPLEEADVALQPIGFEGPVSVHNGTITNTLVVSTGNGNDFVDVDNIVAHDIVVDTGAGNDGNDPDRDFPVEVDNVTVAGNVTLVGGPGNDRLEVRNEFEEVSGTGIRGNLIVSGGAGNDDITIGGDPEEDRGLNVGKSMIIDAGSGNDLVDIRGATIGLITNIQMGAGNDELDIFDSGPGTGNGMLIANGGPGRDSFFNNIGINSNGVFGQTDNGGPSEIIQSFEFFEADGAIIAIAKAKKGGW